MKQKYVRTLPYILLMLAIVLGLSFGMDTVALADVIINDVQYIYYKDQQAAIKGKTSSGKQNCRKVEQGNDTWDSGWYVVSDNVSIDRHITVNGDVHLILMDGKQLNVRSIRDGSDSKLTIYAQSTGNDMGKLIINNKNGDGIRLYKQLTINGGDISAAGSLSGIILRDGNLIINGGKVSAKQP